jgi:hypothetical protein
MPYDPVLLVLGSLNTSQFIPVLNLLADAGCEVLGEMLPQVELKLQEVCEVRVTPDFTCFKLDQGKLEAWLLRKGRALIEAFTSPYSSEEAMQAASVMWQFLTPVHYELFCRQIGFTNSKFIFPKKREHSPDPQDSSSGPVKKVIKKSTKVKELPDTRGMNKIGSYFKSK